VLLASSGAPLNSVQLTAAAVSLLHLASDRHQMAHDATYKHKVRGRMCVCVARRTQAGKCVCVCVCVCVRTTGACARPRWQQQQATA
jgi:hypothetical protein